MCTYVDKLGMLGLEHHDHLIITKLPKILDNKRVLIHYEQEYAPTNCIYGFDIEYGHQFMVNSIQNDSIILEIFGNQEMEEVEVSFRDIKIGDKLHFTGALNRGGEYAPCGKFKYLEL
jgi:hypothetical protein